MIIAKPKNITDEDDFAEFKGDNSLLRLDIACGNNKREGFKGVDISSDTDADYICNLNEYPWELIDKDKFNTSIYESELIKESSVYEVHCSHYAEHVPDLIKFMEECYRIMMDQSILTIIAPYYTSVRAWQDPTHVRAISEMTWLYYNEEWRKINKLEHYNIKCNFKIESNKFVFDPTYISKSDEAREWARKHLNNVVMDIIVVLRAIKRKA